MACVRESLNDDINIGEWSIPLPTATGRAGPISHLHKAEELSLVAEMHERQADQLSFHLGLGPWL